MAIIDKGLVSVQGIIAGRHGIYTPTIEAVRSKLLPGMRGVW